VAAERREAAGAVEQAELKRARLAATYGADIDPGEINCEHDINARAEALLLTRFDRGALIVTNPDFYVVGAAQPADNGLLIAYPWLSEINILAGGHVSDSVGAITNMAITLEEIPRRWYYTKYTWSMLDVAHVGVAIPMAFSLPDLCGVLAHEPFVRCFWSGIWGGGTKRLGTYPRGVSMYWLTPKSQRGGDGGSSEGY
jgi:hypothetical protein